MAANRPLSGPERVQAQRLIDVLTALLENGHAPGTRTMLWADLDAMAEQTNRHREFDPNERQH